MSYDDIQDLIDEGLGFAADELGTPFDVYRVGSASTGDVIQPGNKIASSYPVFFKVAYGGGMRESLESEKNQGIIWYQIIADMSPFLLGDVFVQNDPIYGAGYSSVNFSNPEFKGFALADHSPIKKRLGGRLNCNVQIYRPNSTPDGRSRNDKTLGNGLPVTLTNGVFSVGFVNQTASKIPAGLISQGRSYGDRSFDGVPGEQRKSGWEIYLPALNGFNVRQGDRIIGPDGARYIVIIPFTQKVGATGSQWFLEREASGRG